MKGKLPLFLRLTLVVILAVSFSLVPMAVQPTPASAGAVASATGDILVQVGSSPNQPGVTANYLATSTFNPTIVANVGDNVTFRSTIGSAFAANSVALVSTTLSNAQVLPILATITGASTTSPLDVVAGVGATVVTITAAGTFTITLPAGAAGVTAVPSAALNLNAAGAGVAVALVAGANAMTSGATTGTFTISAGNLGAATGLPIRLPTASTTTVTVGTLGLFLVTLPAAVGTSTVISGTGTVTGSPQALAAGVNTITTTVVGTFTIALGLVSTAGSGLRTIRTNDTYPAVALTDTVAAGTGTGDFSPGSQIIVTIDGAAAATVPATSLVGLTTGATITDAGRGRFQTSIVIPALARSTAGSPHVIKITDGSISRTVNLVLNPKVVFTPDHAAKDKDITLAGSGFRGSNSIDVEVRDATTPFTGGTTSLIVSQGLLTTDASGSFTGVIKVPSVMVTANSINARDGGNATANAWNLNTELRTFLVDPSMTISPTTGLPGSQAVINGTELIPGSVITTLTIGGVSALASLSTTAVGAAGTANEGKLQSATVTLPIGLSPGKKSITLTGTLAATGANTSAGGSVTISALPLNISPNSGAVGRDVVLNMNNMAAGTAIAAGTTVASSVTVGGLPAITNAYTTDSGGNATVTVTIPTALTATGDQNVIVTVGATVATGTYTVKKPTMTLSPVDQIRNGTVNVSGSGWVSEKTVTIGIGAVGTVGATTISVTPGSDGKFASSFRVPTDFGSDTNNTISATDTVGNTMDPVNLHVTAPSIVVSPLVVAWGQTLTITGKGFRGGVNMRYELPWGTIATSGSFPTATYSDSTGSFTASLNMPTLSKGVRSIGVTDGISATTATIEVQEAAATVAVALSPIAAQLVRVWGFDAASQTWKLYDPSVPAELNTLSALSKGSGYFINVKAATTITTGSGNIVSLSPGWQILGW